MSADLIAEIKMKCLEIAERLCEDKTEILKLAEKLSKFVIGF